MPFIDIEGEVPTNLEPFTIYQAYNILDAAVTAQLVPVIQREFNENHRATYLRELRVQALCLEMSTKGFPVDQFALAELLWKLEKDEQKCLAILAKFCEAVGVPPVNPNSDPQVKALFYDHLSLPVQFKYDRATKTRKPTVDQTALEKLAKNYPYIAAPFVNAIDGAKTARKMASVFKRGLEPTTGLLRCNFSLTTETGRLASQQNPYRRGTNAQNLTDEVRQVICAPDGYAIVNLDLKTAESIATGFISRDRAYIAACLGGDLHTSVAKLVWPSLNWLDNPKLDRAIANQHFYRGFTYRDMSKRGGHATNYYGTDRTVATALNVETRVITEFQANYFGAFKGIPEWHLETIARVQLDGVIVTPLGRERRFWGRPDDTATWREAIAFAPQSLVADVWNEGLCQLQRFLLRYCADVHPWDNSGFKRPVADLRAQVHDSGVFLVPLDILDDIVPIMQQQLEFPVDFGELGTMLIPTDASVGRRWNKKPKYGNGSGRFMHEGLDEDWTPGSKLAWA